MSQLEELITSYNNLLDLFKRMRFDGFSTPKEELEDFVRNLPESVIVEDLIREGREITDVDTLQSAIGKNEVDIQILFSQIEERLLLDPDVEVFLGKIVQEDSGGGGEYDQWLEVDSDTVTGGLKTKTNGHTHTSTGLSLFEVNGVIGIPADTYVIVRFLPGDNPLYVFEYQAVNDVDPVEGGRLVSGVSSAPTADEGWIYKYDRDGVIEDAHADPRGNVDSETSQTVYLEDVTTLGSESCFTKYAFDARGHVIGWWYYDGGTWESPWGFDEPS